MKLNNTNFTVFTRGVRKKYFEQVKMAGEKKQLWQFLFPNDDTDDSSTFQLDELVPEIYGVVYRERDAESNVRTYQAGKGSTYDIPRASEKTPITEKLNDAVVAGLEGNESAQTQASRLFGNIAKQHRAGFNMTKNRQALDVFVKGVFEARGKNDADLQIDLDFGRSGDLDLAYDFTAGGATWFEGAKIAQDALIAKGAPIDQMFTIQGLNWQSQFSSDEAVQKYMQNNGVNLIVETQMMPGEFKNVEGLVLLGKVRAPDMLAPIWVFAYQPGVPYKADKSAAAEPFIAPDVAIWGSLASERYTVQRGIDALDKNEKKVRESGELVIDDFTSKDPVKEFVRAQSRHAFVPGYINHTAKTTGTFA